MENRTFPTKFLLVIALWLPLSNFNFKAYGDPLLGDNNNNNNILPSPTCVNCSKCEYPCQIPPPPLLGYPSYGAPPPPLLPPPPPLNKCPPTSGVQCCTPPPPPYNFKPPNPYTYVPNNGDEEKSSASILLKILVPLHMFYSSFVVF
ncbi:hypothetical protein AAHE18_11G047900 [Arachis hypogaea]